jgi:hypothetical protein
MQSRNLKFVGATIALAALATGCSEPASVNGYSSAPALASFRTLGRVEVCKFAVIPNTTTRDLVTQLTAVVKVVAKPSNTEIGNVSLTSNGSTFCADYAIPAGTTSLEITETPASGVELYAYYSTSFDGTTLTQSDFVIVGPTATPAPIVLSNINPTYAYGVNLKNQPGTPQELGCTYTQGYWKTHSLAGPAPYDDGWKNLGGGLEHNTIFFNSGKTWLELWNTPPRGSAYIQLAHQYMAAKLNVLNGASAPSSVTSAIAAAEAYFTSGTGDITGLASTLGSYNEGLIGPGHCDS